MSSVPVQFVVPDVSDVLRFFDTVEIQKSVDGTPFTDAVSLTAPSALGASLVGSSSVFTHLAGTTLNLDVGGTLVSHTFVGPNPMTISSVLREMQSLPLVDVTSVSGKLKIITQELGTIARLVILDGTANTELGFSTDQIAYGIDKNVDLLPGVSRYTYLDRTYPSVNGWYRIRFVNNLTGKYDTWQEWFLGPGAVAIDPASLIQATAKLTDLEGKVLEGHEITIVNCFSPLIQDTYFVAGSSVTVKTDSSGMTSLNLIRGSVVDVIIEGTSIIRRIQVPESGDSFDLLDPGLQVDDTFGIQEPDLPAAVRHS